jgi:hypothetical protein
MLFALSSAGAPARAQKRLLAIDPWQRADVSGSTEANRCCITHPDAPAYIDSARRPIKWGVCEADT